MFTYYVSKEDALAIYQNGRWFAPFYFKSKKLASGLFKVVTTYGMWRG